MSTPERVISHIKPRIALAETDKLPVLTAPLHDNADEKAPAFWLVGAHGGAGTTTLSHIWKPAGDAGKAFPSRDDFTGCVIVCRTTLAGLEAAHNAVLQIRGEHAGNCHLVGCLSIADAPGKLPKAIAQKLRVLEEITTVWKLPFINELRVTDLSTVAQWEPGTDTEQTAKRKAKITETVPRALRTTGSEIFGKAFDIHTAHTI